MYERGFLSFLKTFSSYFKSVQTNINWGEFKNIDLYDIVMPNKLHQTKIYVVKTIGTYFKKTFLTLFQDLLKIELC